MSQGKLFKRLSAIAVALAIILSLIPAGILPTKVQGVESSATDFGYLHATYDEDIDVDNDLKDDAWRRKLALSDGLKISAAWDQEYLYFAITSDTEAALSDLKVNNVSVAVTSGKELRIPFSAFNIVFDREAAIASFDISFTLGGKAWTGILALDTFSYAKKPVALTAGYGAPAMDGWKMVMNSYGTGASASGNYQHSIYHGSVPELVSSLKSPTVVEFDVTVKYMPDSVQPTGKKQREFYKGALNITIIDDGESLTSKGKMAEAMLTALYKDAATGKLCLLHWNNSEGKYESVAIDDYEAGKQYHLRIEYSYTAGDGITTDNNDIVSAKYYVNGKLVKQATNVKMFDGAFTTSNQTYMQILTVANETSDQAEAAGENGPNRVHVDIENLSVAHLVPLAERVSEPYLTPAFSNVLVQPGADESQLNFTWFSQSDAIGKITYAKASDLVEGELPANAATVTADRTESKKDGYSGNKATITGLLPSTTYCYQITNGTDVSRICYVTTGDTEDDTFSFVFAGDPQIGRGYDDETQNIECIKGDGEAWGLTLSQVVNASQFEGIDFLMSAGDQTNNFLDTPGLELQYDAFTNHNELLSLPTVTVLGNHDAYSGSVFATHMNHPNMLTKEDGTYYGSTYDGESLLSADYYFTYGKVLFLVLNTNTFTANDSTAADTARDLAAAEDHWAFIDRVMEETEDMDIDWTIVLYHQSPYGSSYHNDYTLKNDSDFNRTEQYAYINIRKFLVPKLYEVGVDLVLSGHDHCYTRTHILKPATDSYGNYADAAVITPYEDGSYVYADGTTEPTYVSWTDGSGNTYTDLKVSSKPVKVINPDGILHITGGSSSGSQINSVKYEGHYAAATSKPNTRQVTRIDISENELTIVTYNLGANNTELISEIDRFTIEITVDRDAIEAVEDSIEEIGEVKLESKAAIEAARAAYDALTDKEKALVANYETLTAAEAKLQQLQATADKATLDKAAADAAAAKITDIGTVTLNSKAAIEAARAAYDALTADQKALVANYETLTAAEAKLQQLQAAADKAAADKAAADAAAAKITDIGTVTLNSKAAIEAARAAYDALTADQKALVANYETLTAAEAKLEQLQATADKAALDKAAADAAADKITDIGTVTLNSKAAIEAARAAYDALTADQKALVANYETLTAAEAKLEQLQATADKEDLDKAAADFVADKITNIGTVTLNSKAAIEAARAAYDALTADQKALVANYATLTAAEAKLEQLQAAADKAAADKAAADAAAAKITAIGTVTLNSKTAIEAARAAYDALTADQKALVANYETLTAAEAQLKALQDAANKPGSPEKPIEIPADKETVKEEAKVEAGSEQHYELDEKLAGKTITIKGEDAYAIIDGKKYEAVDGVLEVKLPVKTGKIPVVIGNAGTKAGTFSITIATPSEDNSDTGDNAAVVLFSSLMMLSVLAAGALLVPDIRKRILQ